MEFPAHPDSPRAVSASRVHYPAGAYLHPASGLFQLRVVRSGSSYAEIDLGGGRRQVFTRPGDILVSLGDRPSFFAIEEGRDLSFVQASADLLGSALGSLAATLADLQPAARRPFRDPLIADLAIRMEEFVAASPAAADWAFGVIVALTLDAAKRQRSRSNSPQLTDQVLSDVEAMIAARLDRPLAVAELAARAGMGERAFSAAFRKTKGLPVHQYVLRRRVERAIDLLRSSDIPLAEVAQRAGFAHQAHMTRTLRRLKGRTPKQVRGDQ